MSLEGGPVGEEFFNKPDHGIVDLRHFERKTAWLEAGQPNVFRKVRGDESRLLLGRTNQLPRKTNGSRPFFLFNHPVAFVRPGGDRGGRIASDSAAGLLA